MGLSLHLDRAQIGIRMPANRLYIDRNRSSGNTLEPMIDAPLTSILSRIRRISAEVGGASDAQLLERFASNRDEAAFELLVWRHARLVFGVSRRVLRDLQDSEDAFQATFLTLARHARRIARREAVASWLYKVAYRVALAARHRRARRGACERQVREADRLAAAPDADESAENRELRRVLDLEIGRLPERFRAPVVLCYLEGKTVDEAAVQLRCPRGTVASRLARARERLRVRLAGRGLAPSAGLALISSVEVAPRPLSVVPTLMAAVPGYAAGGVAADGVLSPRVTSLTEEVSRAMFGHKLRTGLAVLAVILGMVAVGGGSVLGLRASGRPEAGSQEQGDLPEALAADRAADSRGPQTTDHPATPEPVFRETFGGRLEPLRAVDVRPAVSGTVESVHFKAGAEVKRGNLLFELESRVSQLDVVKAEANLTAAEARKKQVDADVARVRKLAAALQVSQEEFDERIARAATEAAAVSSARAELGRTQIVMGSTWIRAPMAGTVGRPLVEPGTLVFRGQDSATLLTTITALDPIGVTFDVDERSFLRYKRLLRESNAKGASSRVRLEVTCPDGSRREGTLEGFEDRAVPHSGAVRARGSVANEDRSLLPGMFVQVQIALFAPAPQGSSVPSPLPGDLVSAWEDAGAMAGWLGMDEHGRHGFLQFREGETGKQHEVPAFSFPEGTVGLPANLPQPRRAFGLEFQGANFTDAGLKGLAGLKELRTLALCGTAITDAGLKELSTLKGLRELDLSGTQVTDAGIKELASLKGLQLLNLCGAHVTNDGLKELAGFKELTALHLGGTQITDAGLKNLAELKGLRGLYLGETAVTDAGLKELVGLSGLQFVALYGTRITDAGLKDLSRLKRLQWLSLYDTSVTDAGIKELLGLEGLTDLYLGGTRITDAGVKELVALKSLQDVGLRNTRITGAALKDLARLKGLQRLNLIHTQLTDADLKPLAGLKELEELLLGEVPITDAGLKELTGLKKLQDLGLSGARITGAGLKELAGLKQLQRLNLSRTQLTDMELKELVGLKSLQWLNLDGTPVSDTGLKELAPMKGLRELDLRSTQVTDEGVAELQKASPALRITR
jgi:internalin A